MDIYVPGEVYNNLVKMMEYRGVKLTQEVLAADNVVQKLNHYEFVSMMGVRGKEDVRGEATVMVVLIAPNSKYSNKSGDFKKILKILPKIKPEENLDIIFVSEYALTTHIKKTILQYRVENPRVRLEHYDYEIFMLEVPRHESVMKHVIPSEEEVAQFCRIHYIDRNNFPKLSQSDAMAVWLGLRPGMCVKVMRISETAGYAIAYRICIK